jgi:hypothetical protein
MESETINLVSVHYQTMDEFIHNQVLTPATVVAAIKHTAVMNVAIVTALHNAGYCRLLSLLQNSSDYSALNNWCELATARSAVHSTLIKLVHSSVFLTLSDH